MMAKANITVHSVSRHEQGTGGEYLLVEFHVEMEQTWVAPIQVFLSQLDEQEAIMRARSYLHAKLSSLADQTAEWDLYND